MRGRRFDIITRKIIFAISEGAIAGVTLCEKDSIIGEERD